jgi:hypothetical protein
MNGSRGISQQEALEACAKGTHACGETPMVRPYRALLEMALNPPSHVLC